MLERSSARCSAIGVTAVRPPQALARWLRSGAARPARRCRRAGSPPAWSARIGPPESPRQAPAPVVSASRLRSTTISTRFATCDGAERHEVGLAQGAGRAPCALGEHAEAGDRHAVADIDPARLGRIEGTKSGAERPIELQDGEIDAGLRARRRAGHEGRDGWPPRRRLKRCGRKRPVDARRPGRRPRSVTQWAAVSTRSGPTITPGAELAEGVLDARRPSAASPFGSREAAPCRIAQAGCAKRVETARARTGRARMGFRCREGDGAT